MAHTEESLTPPSSIPADDFERNLTVARPKDDATLSHLGLVGDTHTVLVTAEETAGRCTLIDMLVPAGGGPPPHRHDVEVMFSVLEGEIEVTFRGEQVIARAGKTVNVPANAPHAFRNVARESARVLCRCTPPGQEVFFAQVGVPVASRTEAPAKLDPEAQRAFAAKAMALAPAFRTELLLP